MSVPAIRSVLLLPDYDPNEDGDIVVTIFRAHLLPEVAQLRDEASVEIRGEIVRLALDLICKQDGDLKDYMVTQFCSWFKQSREWKESVEATFEDIVSATPSNPRPPLTGV